MLKSYSVLLVLAGIAFASCGTGTKQDPLVETGVWVARVDSEDMLLGGRTAKGKIGDYKIWNRKVAFIIQDVGLTSGYKRYGGVPVDADTIRDDQPATGASQLGELFFGFNQRLFAPAEIALVEATPENPRAVLRVEGEDAYFDWLGSFMGDLFSMDSIDCRLTYEYSLGPDDEALRIDVIIESLSPTGITLDMVEVALIMGDGLDSFFEGPGFDVDDHVGEFPAWLGMGDAISYGLFSEEGPLDMILNVSNVAFGTYPALDLERRQPVRLTRYLAVAEGGLDRVQAIFRQITGDSDAGLLSGQVVADDTALERGVRVHVLDEEGHHVSAIVAGPDGIFETALASGSYNLVAKADGFDPSGAEPVAISPEQPASAELVIRPSTPFTWKVTETGSGPVPARLTFLRQDASPANILPRSYGEERHPSGAALVIHAGSGEGSGVIPMGTYEVTASRGFEYEMDRQAFESDGTPIALDLEIERVIDSSGYLGGDFHVHAEFSPDSNVAREHRVRTALSENLEILTMTEHDTIRDFTPAVEALGVSGFVQAVAGSEITTYLYGHFNAWPLTEKPGQINYGGIEWFETMAPDLFHRIRDSENHDVIIQVNHPRSAAIGGYFNAVGLDIASGTIDRWDNWSDDFDSIEVFNGGCSNGDNQELRDWFDFLNRGYRVSVGGGSDSHSEFSELGSPRVYLRSDHDVPGFTHGELVENFRDMRVFVSCGPFVRFTIDGSSPGDLVSGPGPFTAHLRVDAPSYMILNEVRIIRNGEVAWSLPAAEWPGAQGALRLETDVELAPASDGWYALEVKGNGGQHPITGDSPYAITNPVWVDVDGNGSFDPPLPPYLPAEE